MGVTSASNILRATRALRSLKLWLRPSYVQDSRYCKTATFVCVLRAVQGSVYTVASCSMTHPQAFATRSSNDAKVSMKRLE